MRFDCSTIYKSLCVPLRAMSLMLQIKRSIAVYRQRQGYLGASLLYIYEVYTHIRLCVVMHGQE